MHGHWSDPETCLHSERGPRAEKTSSLSDAHIHGTGLRTAVQLDLSHLLSALPPNSPIAIRYFPSSLIYTCTSVRPTGLRAETTTLIGWQGKWARLLFAAKSRDGNRRRQNKTQRKTLCRLLMRVESFLFYRSLYYRSLYYPSLSSRSLYYCICLRLDTA